jgi:hypothetical protein
VIRVKLSDGRLLAIRFQHKLARFFPDGKVIATTQQRVPVEGEQEFMVRRATFCSIHFVKDEKETVGTVLAGAWAKCHPRDSFNRSVGRKTSLAKAIMKAKSTRHLNHDDARNIWFHYFVTVRNNPVDTEPDFQEWLSQHPQPKKETTANENVQDSM